MQIPRLPKHVHSLALPQKAESDQDQLYLLRTAFQAVINLKELIIPPSVPKRYSDFRIELWILDGCAFRLRKYRCLVLKYAGWELHHLMPFLNQQSEIQDWEATSLRDQRIRDATPGNFLPNQY